MNVSSILRITRCLPAVFAALALFTSPGEAREGSRATEQAPNDARTDCLTVMRLHGLLTRAQFQCEFKDYSQDVVIVAQACAQTLPEAEFKNALSIGMQAFDRREKERGRQQVCRDMLRDFPQVLRSPQTEAAKSPQADKPIQWNEKDAIRVARQDKAIFETRICLQDAVKIALRRGMRDRKEIVAFSSKLCVAQSSLMGRQFGFSSTELANSLNALAHSELDTVLQHGR